MQWCYFIKLRSLINLLNSWITKNGFRGYAQSGLFLELSVDSVCSAQFSSQDWSWRLFLCKQFPPVPYSHQQEGASLRGWHCHQLRSCVVGLRANVTTSGGHRYPLLLVMLGPIPKLLIPYPWLLFKHTPCPVPSHFSFLEVFLRTSPCAVLGTDALGGSGKKLFLSTNQLIYLGHPAYSLRY